jgi:hypothetical protein
LKQQLADMEKEEDIEAEEAKLKEKIKSILHQRFLYVPPFTLAPPTLQPPSINHPFQILPGFHVFFCFSLYTTARREKATWSVVHECRLKICFFF